MAHPIIGDATHGKGPLNRWWAGLLGQQRLWLHAWQLDVPHPVTGALLSFHSGLAWPQAGPALAHPAAPPDLADWQRLMQQWPWAPSPVAPDVPGCELTLPLEVHSAT